MKSANPSRPGCDSSTGAEPGDPQSAQIACVLQLVEQRLDAGEAVDDAAIIAEHPELMPELAQRLCDIRFLHDALSRAAERSSADEVPSEHTALLDEQFDFLRDELERYEVLDVVHHGGQGIVFRARQQTPSRIVALKVLLHGPLASQRQLDRFDREIELIARLNHPNIVTVYDSGRVRNRPYFTMEFVDGGTISDHLLLMDLTPREVVRLMVKVCRAVHYAHQNGIIHRDLKPSNILVDADGEPHVFDFGLAKDTLTPPDRNLSMSGQILGTLPFLSPEQAGGLDGQVDVRSDVYALGVVLYYLLTDAFPYRVDGEATDVRNAIVATEPAPLRKVVALGGVERAPGLEQVNADLEAILDKALAKRKDERYQSAAELADDLERYCASEAVAARHGQRVYRLRKALRKHRTPLAVVAVLLAAGAVSWVQVRAQRDNARMAARIAVDEFSTTLSDVEERVRPLAGGVAVCDELVERVASEIPRLEALVGSDDALAPVLTQLKEKQGDIARLRGRDSEAQEYYQRYLDAALDELKTDPNNSDSAVAAVRGYRRLGDVSDAPMRVCERGVEFARPLLARFPDCPGLRLELAELYRLLATEAMASDNFRLGYDYYESLAGLIPEGHETSPHRAAWRSLAVTAAVGRGNALAELGETEQALEALNESLRLREAILAEDPADTSSRYALLRSHRILARHLSRWHRLDEAMEHLVAAAEIADLLLAMDPEMAQWQEGGFAVNFQLAMTYLNAEQLEKARVHCDKAAACAQRRYDKESESASARADLAFARVLRARTLIAQESWESARELLARSVDIRQQLLNDDPDNVALMGQLAETLYLLGFTDRKLLDTEAAIESRTAALDLRKRIVAIQPGIPRPRTQMIGAFINLANAHMDRHTAEGDAEAARLLAAAERELSELREGGDPPGHENTIRKATEAISHNKALLLQRHSSATQRADEPRDDD